MTESSNTKLWEEVNDMKERVTILETDYKWIKAGVRTVMGGQVAIFLAILIAIFKDSIFGGS